MAAINDILIPSLTLEEIASDGSTLTNPAADYRRLFLGEDGLLHLRDSAGTVTTPSGGTTIATDTIWNAAGDLVQGTGSDTAARLALGTALQVLRVNAGATAVEWGAASATPPDQYEAFLTSPVTITSAATFVDGPSLSLPVGSWHVTVEAECSNAHASNTYQTIRIYDGTTVWKARGSWSSGGAGGVQCLQATARVTLAGTTTVKLQVADLRGSSNGVILDTAANSGTTDKCTSITAIKITPI
jgi:hypothetical protein